MRTSRTSIALAIVLASLAPALPVAADQPSASDAVRVSGVVRLDQPPFRLDPRTPWALGTWGPRVPGMTPGHLVAPIWDPLAPWLPIQSPGGVEHWRGARFEGPLDLDDARVTGWLSMLWNTDVHTLPDTSASVHAVTVRLESAGGSWVGTLSGTGDPATGSFRIGGSLDGAGAFSGSTLIVDIQCLEPGTAWRVDGLAVMGALPPAAAFAG